MQSIFNFQNFHLSHGLEIRNSRNAAFYALWWEIGRTYKIRGVPKVAVLPKAAEVEEGINVWGLNRDESVLRLCNRKVKSVATDLENDNV